jgi:hypothetical protein
MDTGLKRDTIDKFYTKNDIVNLCMNIFKSKILLNENDLIIEPSAGSGAFINEIKSIVKNYLFYDIEPESPEIIEQDFLSLDISKININTKIHIIGNPPFGRQSSLANKFIKKCCLFSDTISFILPKSFKKESMKKAFSLNFHLLSETDLPENSFTINHKEYNVPCVFQIWIKQDFNREVSEKLNPKGFIFVSKDDNPDISFRRVGVNAGVISREIDKSVQSHYFIKFTNGLSIEKNLFLLNNIIFCGDNTVGPKSISKQELIFEFNKFL